MKTALFLFLSLLSITCFSQSRKAMNKTLLEKHAQLIRQNDSIVVIITNNNKVLTSLSGDSYRASRNLFDRRMAFNALKQDITRVREQLEKLGFSPNTLVRQEELTPLYQIDDTSDFHKQIKTTGIKLQPFNIQRMEDLSGEKIKVQNERFIQKNQEYSAVIDSNLQVIKAQEALVPEFNDAIQKVEGVSIVLVKNKKALQQKYEVLLAKLLELEAKKEEAEIAAENARLEREEKEREKRERALQRSSGKKVKTVKFVPPVIVDRDWDDESERYGNEDAVPPKEIEYYSTEPAPPAPIRREERLPQEPVILDVVEEPAEFPGGMTALKKYLADNVVFPEVAKELGISGKVYLRFVVSEQGNISNVKVMRGIQDCKECDQEAIRVVKKMPNWTPGKNNGKAVNMYYNLPIIFKLSDK
jgi:TonB family protein